MAVKISSSEADQLGEETIAFKDGSGYMAEVAVFHELHCIKARFLTDIISVAC